MSDKKQKPVEQGEGAPLWMVSFTDAMTNILTFFILLITFSSYGTLTHRFGGPFPTRSGPSLFKDVEFPQDGVLKPSPALAIPSPPGSERADFDAGPEKAERPRRPSDILDTEAYRDRRVFYVPSKSVFYGVGSFVTEVGARELAPIAEFLRRTGTQVVISESSGPEYGGAPMFYRSDRSAQRAYAVMEYFTRKQSLPEDRFAIGATTSVPAERFSEAMIEIAVLTRKAFP
jgi:hypothetical protein